MRDFPGIGEATPDGHGEENQTLADPLGDLLLSGAAILVLAIILILPLGAPLSGEAAQQDPPQDEEIAQQALGHALANRPPMVLLATRRGIELSAEPSGHIALNEVLDNRQLSQMLSQGQDADRRVVLFIEPDGLESAFAVETVARRQLRGTITQIRLNRPCRQLRLGALRRLCSFEDAHVRQ